MHLAVLLDRWHPHGGGLEVYLSHVLPALVARGHEVHLLARDATQGTPEGVEAVEVRRALPRPWRDRAEAAAQRRQVRALGVDAVLSLRAVPSPGAAFLPMGGSAPQVRAARGAGRPGYRERVLLALEEATLREASLVLPSSPKVAAEIAARRPSVRSELLPLPLLRPPGALRPPPMDAPDAPLRVVACGRDALRHGAAPALAWFRALRRQRPRARLDLWGKSLRHLERCLGAGALELTREGVVLHGWEDDFPAALREADLLLHPTLYDSFSLVCLEAVAAGVPVVTTEAAGAAALLAGPLLATASRTDPEGAAAAMLALLAQAADTAGSGWRDAVEEVRERFALDAHVRRLESLLPGTAPPAR